MQQVRRRKEGDTLETILTSLGSLPYEAVQRFSTLQFAMTHGHRSRSNRSSYVAACPNLPIPSISLSDMIPIESQPTSTGIKPSYSSSAGGNTDIDPSRSRQATSTTISRLPPSTGLTKMISSRTINGMPWNDVVIDQSRLAAYLSRSTHPSWTHHDLRWENLPPDLKGLSLTDMRPLVRSDEEARDILTGQLGFTQRQRRTFYGTTCVIRCGESVRTARMSDVDGARDVVDESGRRFTLCFNPAIDQFCKSIFSIVS